LFGNDDSATTTQSPETTTVAPDPPKYSKLHAKYEFVNWFDQKRPFANNLRHVDARPTFAMGDTVVSERSASSHVCQRTCADPAIRLPITSTTVPVPRLSAAMRFSVVPLFFAEREL
jgi:hypothetical protein